MLAKELLNKIQYPHNIIEKKILAKKYIYIKGDHLSTWCSFYTTANCLSLTTTVILIRFNTSFKLSIIYYKRLINHSYFFLQVPHYELKWGGGYFCININVPHC